MGEAGLLFSKFIMNACHDFWNYQPVDPVLCGNYSTIYHNYEADMAAIYIIYFFSSSCY